MLYPVSLIPVLYYINLRSFPSLLQHDSFDRDIITLPSFLKCMNVLPEKDWIGFPVSINVLIWVQLLKSSAVSFDILLFERLIVSA